MSQTSTVQERSPILRDLHDSRVAEIERAAQTAAAGDLNPLERLRDEYARHTAMAVIDGDSGYWIDENAELYKLAHDRILPHVLRQFEQRPLRRDPEVTAALADRDV